MSNWKLRKDHKTSIPVPPGNLIFSATGTRNVEWFLDSGVATAEAFREALASIGRPVESFENVLELGCSCGRVLRQWSNVDGPRFWGTDYNPRGVEWCKANLDHVTASTNKLEPPLSYESGSFDLCYAVSVFTHLPESLQEPWLSEMHRVIRPGGIFLVTLSGEGDLVRLTSEEQSRFHSGEVVVVDAQFAGTNLCGVYHPRSFVEKNWSRYFNIVKFLPRGAKGIPMQDLYVLQSKQP